MMTDSELPIFTFGDAMAILRRRTRLAVFTFIAVLVPSLLVTFLMPPLYQAEARLWVDRYSPAADYTADSPRGNSQVTTFRNLDREEEISTQAEMLRSRVIMEAVVDRLALTQDKLDHIRDARRHVRALIDGVIDGARFLYNELKYLLHLSRRPSAEEEAYLARVSLVDDAIERIRVSPASDSNLLTVSFRSSDPQLARDVVNALVDEFMRFSGDMKQSRALNFFSDVSRKLARDLAEAESALLALRSSTRSYAPEQQRGMLLSQLSEAGERARSFEVAKAELRGRIGALQARLADEPAKIVVREQTRRDPTVDALRAKLAELTHRRATVGRSGDSGSIPARQLDTEIAALRSALARPTANLSDTTVTELNPVHQQLREQLMRSEVELAALESQADAAARMLADYQRELAASAEGDVKIKEAERRVRHLEESYDLHLRNREQAQLREERSLASLSEVRIIDYAPYPLKAVRPRPLLYLGIALAAALLLALGVPFLTHFNDTTIRDARDIRRQLGVSFVATFPARGAQGRT